MLVNKGKLINFIEKFELNDRVSNVSIVLNKDGMNVVGHDVLRTCIFNINDRSESFEEEMILRIRNVIEFRKLLESFEDEIDITVKSSKIGLKDGSLNIKLEQFGDDERSDFQIKINETGFVIGEGTPVEYVESVMVDGTAISKAIQTLSPVKAHCLGFKINEGNLVVSVEDTTISGDVKIKGAYEGSLNVTISDYLKLITKIHKGMIKVQYGGHPSMMFTIENDSTVSKYIVVVR